MHTSYFAKAKKLENAISIALYPPKWFTGKLCQKLAPSWDILSEYKRTGDEQVYTKAYTYEVLEGLDPRTLFNELGENAILCCWEANSKFCHRHIVARWFEEHLNIIVPEL